MLKRFFLLIGIVAISISLCACDSEKDVHMDEKNEESIGTESFSRVVDYEINNTVMDVLSSDDNAIKLLDEVYIAAKEALENLSAQQFYTKVYDAVRTFNNRFQESVSKIENREYMKKVILETADYALDVQSVLTAGYEYASGNVSIENAAFDILIAVDSILNYMYKDYIPIYQPRRIDVDSIYDMYEENELAAEAEFENQLLCVSGTVYEVARDVMGQPYVGLATSKEASYELLRCYTNSIQSQDIVALKKGDKVSCVIQIIDKDLFDINAKLWRLSRT